MISIRLRCDGDVVYGLLSLLKLCFQEKLLKICYKYPYLEPTQVVKERILRPTGERLLRNSAKWSRNFGRRDASERRPQ